MIVSLVVVGSILLQVMAGAAALRLVRPTKVRLAWSLVAAGLWGMAGRRALSFLAILSGEAVVQPELAFELLGLLTSCCMLIGVWSIGPLFEQIRRARDEAENHSREAETLAVSLQLALDNAKTLRGLLPICAACKKIRDDRGYWHQVESYIRAHSDAEFSHGICPACAQELYPEYHQRGDPE